MPQSAPMGGGRRPSSSQAGGCHAADEHGEIKRHDAKHRLQFEICQQAEHHVAQVILEVEPGLFAARDRHTAEMLDRWAGHEMSLVTGQPGAMAEVRFFVITMEVGIEIVAAGLIDHFAAKHHAGAFAGEYWIISLILRSIGFVITVVIRKTAASQKRATNLQCAVGTRQNHFALDDSNLRMVNQIPAEDRNKLSVSDHVIVHHQDEFPSAVWQAEVVTARTAQV